MITTDTGAPDVPPGVDVVRAGDDDIDLAAAMAQLGADGWLGIGWPKEHGGRGLSLFQEVIYAEEYARARAPGRAGHIGEGLLGPTIIHFGTPEQQQRWLPPIVAGTELWCQGYSEPGAGSDLANVQTKAELVDGQWVITGQKVFDQAAASTLRRFSCMVEGWQAAPFASKSMLLQEF